MINYAAVTNTGIREHNEDRILLDGAVLAAGEKQGSSEETLFATVCDGVGGEAFGEEAAQIAAEIISAQPPILSEQDALNAVQQANEAILSAQAVDSAHSRMASTVAGIAIQGSDIVVFNVGDSKVYRYRAPYIAQLSVDHTYAKEVVQYGLVVSADALTEGERHRITRCLGDSNAWQPAIVEGKDRVFPGDIYLLCSDGLSDVVTEDTMEAILAQEASLETKCSQLLALALRQGSQDNISIILVEAVKNG